jgi:four helix bundle protein
MGENNLFFKLADSSVKIIFKKTLDFPYRYQSSIGDQLRRSSLSVVLNIIERGARSSFKEKRHFLSITFGSLKETKYLLAFAKELKLIEEELYLKTNQNLNRLGSLIYGYLLKNPA